MSRGRLAEMRFSCPKSRGVSLIEALVALAVMGFGILGVVGIQATLRFNSDIAKQRSEAVRLAQKTVEDRRDFSVYDTTAGRSAFADITTKAAVSVAGGNATYSLTETASDLSDGKSKTLVVDVGWTDRNGDSQGVRLSTAITKVLPEFPASLGVPGQGSPVRLPDGRNSAVPRTAVDQGDGTSKFAPPGGGTLSWVFNNTTGYITSTCLGSICTPASALLLTGFIRFATGATQPTPAMAEVPPSTAFAIGVTVAVTYPTTSTVTCFGSLNTLDEEYFCAVPVDSLLGSKWSGQSRLTLLNLASSISDDNDHRLRVCRYTPVRGSQPVVPTISNAEHPLNYLDVTTSLTQQNFLVIRAGDDDNPFTCPADDPTTPFVNGNTWHHQPSS